MALSFEIRKFVSGKISVGEYIENAE